MPYPNEPNHSPLGARLRERTQPLAPDDRQYGYAHAWLCEALSRILLRVQEAFDPEDPIPPIAPLLDPELCPDWALPWLAQLVGVALPVGVSTPDARALIADVAGFRRGTTAAIEAGLANTLTGNKTVYFRERDGGDAYALEVVTLTGETPDSATTLAALMAQKPGGIVLRYRTVAGQDWQAVKDSGQTWRNVRTNYVSWRDVRDNVTP